MTDPNFQEYCDASQTVRKNLIYFIIGIHTNIKAIQRALHVNINSTNTLTLMSTEIFQKYYFMKDVVT